ncbi:hypothetical protein [Bacteroides pyogenes]|uniref:hypothetical protein n=1 Tax=Bacteroides pyogenes TaxID=310300 RepID=UPI000400FA81|nr:hypothetical protein [Bacteroides pyogenes]
MALFEVFCAVNRAAIRIPSGSMLAKALFEGDGSADLWQILDAMEERDASFIFFLGKETEAQQSETRFSGKLEENRF